MNTIILNTNIIKSLDEMFNVYSDYDTYVLMVGDYYITKDLVINRPNVKIIGNDTNPNKINIYQKTPTCNGLVLSADNIIVQNISVHNEIGDGTCLTISGCNQTRVENCYFYGNINDFAIYYSGPANLTAGQSVIDAYQNDNLNTQNYFDNNCVYTDWNGDAISFSLQSHGSFCNNIIRGGKIAVYMCKNTNVMGNHIMDSTSNGIFISLPSMNLNIRNNKIHNSLYSGIVIRNQLEHGVFNSSLHNIIIDNNIICSSHFHGIEINNLDTSTISNNIINNILNNGMYFLTSTNLLINNNNICHTNKGIYLDIHCDTNTISNNNIYSVFPSYTSNAIYLNNAINTNVNDNTSCGIFSSSTINIISDPNQNTNNKLTNNKTEILNEYQLFDVFFDVTL